MMINWLFTSESSEIEGRVVKNDSRVGGKYTIKDRRNGQDYEGDGEYLKIERPRRSVSTFRMAQFSDTIDRIIVEIAQLEKGCPTRKALHMSYGNFSLGRNWLR
jgi:uncharacterized protein YndB with AHSA1/START domain